MLAPISKSKWTYQTAAHLLNRAGFGGPPAEIEKLVRLGPQGAVSHLVDYEQIPDPAPNPEWAKPDPQREERFRERRKVEEGIRAELKQATTEDERLAIQRRIEEYRRKVQAAERRVEFDRIAELRGWWLNRMAKGPRPLQEKLTLFWHGHFATSFEKVRNAYYMFLQNDTFRRNAAGHWPKLLKEITEDPAMLIWLDQTQSNKRHPNENYAREVMELFALGEGQYTEKDILEAARALTGLTLNRREDKAVFQQYIHDDEPKTILGRTGNFKPMEVIDIILEQPQAARFIPFKLWRYFATENVSTELIAALAKVFRQADLQLKPLLKTMFLSEEFYAPEVVRAQVKSPVQWLVGTVRLLEIDLPPARAAGPVLASLGQNLFAPPNVKGWDGGIAWISTNSLLERYNYASMLVLGANAATLQNLPRQKGPKRPTKAPGGATPPVNVERLLKPEERQDKKALIASLQKRLVQDQLKADHAAALREYLDSQAELDEVDILHTIRLILCTPDYQLT
jgi:uncharacterized protein (DUF1800 family)